MRRNDTKARASFEATMAILDAAGKVFESVPGEPVTFRFEIAGRWVIGMHADQAAVLAAHVERLEEELRGYREVTL